MIIFLTKSQACIRLICLASFKVLKAGSILYVKFYFSRRERAKVAKEQTEDSLKKRPKSNPAPEMPSQVRYLLHSKSD